MTFITDRHSTATFSCSLKTFSLFFSLVTFQYQKQGKDLEKVKQRLAEIANYVDKVNMAHIACRMKGNEAGHLAKKLFFSIISWFYIQMLKRSKIKIHLLKTRNAYTVKLAVVF